MRAHLSSGGRYPVLRSLAIIYVIGACVALIGGLVAAGWALVRFPFTVGDRVILAAASLAGAFFLVLGMLAIAELLKLFIDIERNTRIAALRAAALMERPLTPNDGAISGGAPSQHVNRLDALEEETAEAALLRGH
jgi:hypothetical protein